MKIPYQQLSSDALDALLDEIVTREGTDYGAVAMSLEQRKLQLRSSLEAGEANIVFDAETETVNVINQQAFNEINGNIGDEF
ncbi:hypothetical protein EDC56_1411 [Sinobacterium caligoides]|uniref:Uncharacterized protein n=1 Tax=Sinobacterium caligoides TaxID=933926 RepID=A0A3N2DMG0_9GAMM|nr:YheU family protein [Sinobacterium caligoides]ROS00988.1 hypothetical protein EDC56_1411 [Sinobacterium caligoides]